MRLIELYLIDGDDLREEHPSMIDADRVIALRHWGTDTKIIMVNGQEYKAREPMPEVAKRLQVGTVNSLLEAIAYHLDAQNHLMPTHWPS